MKKFEFRFQTLLDNEERKKKECVTVLEKLRKEISALEMRAAQLETEKNTVLAKTGQGPRSLSVNEYREIRVYASELADRIAELVKKTDEIRNEEEKTAETLKEIVTECKMYEKLKEKQYAEFQENIRKQERQMLEEMTSQKIYKSEAEKNG